MSGIVTVILVNMLMIMMMLLMIMMILMMIMMMLKPAQSMPGRIVASPSKASWHTSSDTIGTCAAMMIGSDEDDNGDDDEDSDDDNGDDGKAEQAHLSRPYPTVSDRHLYLVFAILKNIPLLESVR